MKNLVVYMRGLCGTCRLAKKIGGVPNGGATATLLEFLRIKLRLIVEVFTAR